jgi:predicted small lipoprotein YifL
MQFILEGEALTNFVPAVAVIRRGLVLFALTGCKGYVGGPLSFMPNAKANFVKA